MRFQQSQNNTFRIKMILSVCVFAIILAIFSSGITGFSKGQSNRQKELLSTTINRIITYCYATEGHYPESLDYMKTEYGLTYDESEFYVAYVVQGANIYPDVTILETDGEENEK